MPVPTGDVEVSPNLIETLRGSMPSTSLRHLGKDRLVALAVRMRAHFDDQFAIAGEPRDRRLHAGNKFDAPGGITERPGAVSGLLVERCKSHADQSAVRLALFLAGANPPADRSARRRA